MKLGNTGTLSCVKGTMKRISARSTCEFTGQKYSIEEVGFDVWESFNQKLQVVENLGFVRKGERHYPELLGRALCC